MNYRPEIDGLRAVSVLAVVFFHLGLPGLPGGFVGVDVFFVISGYLITAIVFGESVAGRFSLAAFYDRRIRRIFPALLVTLWATLAASYWLLTPDDYAASAASAAYAAGSIGNVYFYRHTGYFDGASTLMPFLHTWSLAVEEQFYLVWPSVLAALVVVGKGRRHFLLLGVAVIGAASFALGSDQLATDPKAAFYLPLGRAWELALGAGLAFVPPLRLGTGIREIGGAIGLGLIGYAVLTLTGEQSFPGSRALIPTCGAALVIWLTTERTAVGRLLSTRPAVFVGRISYSLYLWHWPVVVLSRHYLSGAPLPPAAAAGALVASLLLSWGSYRWIEQPFRRFRPSHAFSIKLGVGLSAATAAAALAIVAADGLPGRLGPEMQALRDRDVMWEWECPNRVTSSLGPGLCAVGAPWNSAARHGLIWGDSHAEYYAPLLDIAGREEDVAFLLWRSCPAFVREGGVERLVEELPLYNRGCSAERAAALDFLATNDVDFVVLPANWTYFPGVLYRGDPRSRSAEQGLPLLSEGLDELLPEIARPGRVVMLFGDVPHIGYEPIPCVLSRAGTLLRRPCETDPSMIPIAGYRARQSGTIDVLRAKASQPNVVAMIPGDRMCSPIGCPTVINGEFLYRDEHHLRRNLSPATFAALARQLELSALFRDSNAAASGETAYGKRGGRP